MASDKSYATEQRVNDMMSRGIISPLAAWKTGAGTSRANNTIADDPDLTVTVEANSVYEFSVFLNYQGGAQGASDLRWTWSVPASAGMRYQRTLVDTTGAISVGQTQAGADTVSARTNGGGNDLAVTMDGTLITAGNAGAVTLRWAQVTTNAIPTVLQTHSRISFTKIG